MFIYFIPYINDAKNINIVIMAKDWEINLIRKRSTI